MHGLSDILLKPMDSFGMWWKSNEIIFLHWIIIIINFWVFWLKTISFKIHIHFDVLPLPCLFYYCPKSMIQKFATILGSYSIGSICNNLSSSAHVIWTLNILSEWSFRCRTWNWSSAQIFQTLFTLGFCPWLFTDVQNQWSVL